MEMMKPLHLQDPQSDMGEIEAPDNTQSSYGKDKKPSLTNLAGELQDLIITELHPSSAVALSQTNHHFHASVNLHRLPFSVVFDWIREKELMPSHTDYACYTCLRLKPGSAFATSQIKSRRGKHGKAFHTRTCLDCGFSIGKHSPGSFLKIGDEMQVLCMGCEIMRKRFCTLCQWCDSCIKKGSAIVLRKGQCAGPNGEAREVTIRNCCRKHVWEGPTSGVSYSNSGSSFSVIQACTMFEFEKDYGMVASSEWYDGPDDI